MRFYGRYEHTIDTKGRISIPAEIRNNLDPERDGKRLVITPGNQPSNLFIFAEKDFDRIAGRAFGEELYVEPDVFEAQQIMHALAVPLDIDKQGRVTLPEGHLRNAGIRGDVILAGAGDRLVLYNREEFERLEADHWKDYTLRIERARQSLERRRRPAGPGAGE